MLALATVDLNSLLYRYEVDIARIIRIYFNNNIAISVKFRTPTNKGIVFEPYPMGASVI